MPLALQVSEHIFEVRICNQSLANLAVVRETADQVVGEFTSEPSTPIVGEACAEQKKVGEAATGRFSDIGASAVRNARKMLRQDTMLTTGFHYVDQRDQLRHPANGLPLSAQLYTWYSR